MLKRDSDNLLYQSGVENVAPDRKTTTEYVGMRATLQNMSVCEPIGHGKRLDGIVIKIPTKTNSGEFVILEFKRMLDVTDQCIIRAKRVAEYQYVSIRSTLDKTLYLQG